VLSQKKSPVSIEPVDQESAKQIKRILDGQLADYHTHLWGIETSASYLDIMYSPIREGQTGRSTAAAEAACTAINNHYFGFQDRFARHTAPEGFFYLVRWILEAVTAAEKDFRVQHALASCQDDQCPVNWNWGYELRAVIRAAAFRSMSAQDCTDQVPLEQWTQPDSYKAWLDSHLSKAEPTEYLLNIQLIENLPVAHRVAALRSVDGLVADCKREGNQCRVILHTTAETARCLYLRAVQRSQYANQVDRCEIDGKHQLSEAIMTALEGMSNVKLRFLYGLDTHYLASGMSLESPLPWEAVTENLLKPYVIGTDFRGPEAAFVEEGCEAVLRKLYSLLVEVSEKRVQHKLLVLRVHVGESDMFNNLHDPGLEQIGHQNLNIVISILERMQQDKLLQPKKVLIRLGHVTALSISQSYRLRKLPPKACFLELNSRSNLQTFASPDMGSLPIVKLVLSDAVYRFKRLQDAAERMSKYNFLDFTCNTDGAGVMHSSMQEEYCLASNVLHHFKENSAMEDGSFAHVQVLPEDIAVLESCLADGISADDLAGRSLRCDDLCDGVRDLLRFDNFIKSAQPKVASPGKKRRIG